MFKSSIVLLFLSLSASQTEISIVEHRIIPDEVRALRLKPTFINWSLGNNFLLLDSDNSELFEISSSGKIKLSYGIGRRNHRYGELICAGISPSGVQIVDRLENEILTLDFNLNPIQNTSLKHKIFPELAQIDPWGRIFLYSSTYNGIYLFENDNVMKEPFIDFSKDFYSNYCVEDFSINSNGEISILGCDGFFHEYSQNGMKEISIPVEIHNPEFLAPLRDDWLVLSRDGDCLSMMTLQSINISQMNYPIIDVVTLNRSIAILTKEYIFVLNVR